MKVVNINRGWKFFMGPKTIEELDTAEGYGINLPHTWNNFDGQDGGSNYHRGLCFYRKEVDLNKSEDKEYYIEFKGVNAVASVYVNGTLVTTHKGGFSTFRANITEQVVMGLNVIVVGADNTDFDDIYPQNADFTFFGGIYRDVNFIEVNKSRFDLDYLGSEGVQVTPILNEDGTASVTAISYLTNPEKGQKVNYAIYLHDEVILEKSVAASTAKATFEIAKPELWDGIKQPTLYTLKVSLTKDDEVLDEREIRFGIRSFKVDKDGFYLNGRKYPLHGVSRHQDRLDKGWAISKKDHIEDMELIKEVGANTIRLAHYQHDQFFYDLCDENGMVVWAEIPYITMHLPQGDENAISQMKELIIQNYNHPAIMFWGLSNEITIGGESKEQYDLHVKLNNMVHEMDKTRLTTMAAVTMCDTHSKLLEIPDIFSYNHYFGWYTGETKDNGEWLDDFRKEFPDRPIGYSEYGCEAILKYHNSDPKCGDYSEEYQALYHEEMLEIFAKRPYLWATHVWNMFDFGVDKRDEGGVAGRNNKGLVTYDRQTKKDSFFIYKAWWSDVPFVHICGKRYAKRKEDETEIKVYSNQPQVSLYVNDELVETQDGEHVFKFRVPLKGKLKIKAVAGASEDTAVIKKAILDQKKYRLKEVKKEVDNWFEKDGVKYEFKYPEGKFTLNDKFNAIYKTEEGKKVLLNLVGEALQMMGQKDSDPEKFIGGAKKLIGNMSIKRIAAFAGERLPKEMLYRVSEELNKIDKPQDK